MSKSRRNLLERSFEAACEQARNAFRLGNAPARPVILFGEEGFCFADERDEGKKKGFSVCTALDEFEGDLREMELQTLPLPGYGDVLEYLYGRFESKAGTNQVRKRWKQALALAEESGNFSALVSPPKIDEPKNGAPGRT